MLGSVVGVICPHATEVLSSMKRSVKRDFIFNRVFIIMGVLTDEQFLLIDYIDAVRNEGLNGLIWVDDEAVDLLTSCVENAHMGIVFEC